MEKLWRSFSQHGPNRRIFNGPQIGKIPFFPLSSYPEFVFLILFFPPLYSQWFCWESGKQSCFFLPHTFFIPKKALEPVKIQNPFSSLMKDLKFLITASLFPKNPFFFPSLESPHFGHREGQSPDPQISSGIDCYFFFFLGWALNSIKKWDFNRGWERLWSMERVRKIRDHSWREKPALIPSRAGE